MTGRAVALQKTASVVLVHYLSEQLEVSEQLEEETKEDQLHSCVKWPLKMEMVGARWIFLVASVCLSVCLSTR